MHWLTLTSAAFASSDCVGPAVDNAQLVATMDQAEVAFAALDLSSFQTAMDLAVFSVACLNDPLRPQDAARFHRLQGLRQFVAGEEQGARASFRSARSAQPEYSFPTSLVPAGHAIRDLYVRSPPSSLKIPAPVPQNGELWIDGEPSELWDNQSPALLQVISDGAVISTHYMLPGDALPFDIKRPEEGTLFLEPEEQAPRLESGLSRLHRPRFFIGLGLGAAAIGTFAMASKAAATYQQPNAAWGEPELRRQEQLTNGLTIGAGVFGLASAGMIGSAWMVMRW